MSARQIAYWIIKNGRLRDIPILGLRKFAICGPLSLPQFARVSASGPSCARWVSSIIGVRAAGPTIAAHKAPTISSAIEMAMNPASALGNGIEGTARWSLRLFGGFELSILS